MISQIRPNVSSQINQKNSTKNLEEESIDVIGNFRNIYTSRKETQSNKKATEIFDLDSLERSRFSLVTKTAQGTRFNLH